MNDLLTEDKDGSMDCDIEELIGNLAALVKCDPAILRDFPIGLPNLKIPTLGGSVFWDDVGTIKGWRMQRNIFTGHWRILDSDNVRHAWGTNRKMVDIFTQAVEASAAEAEEEGEEQEETSGIEVIEDEEQEVS